MYSDGHGAQRETVTPSDYDDKAKEVYNEGKDHYKENKDEYNNLAKDLHEKGKELLKTSLPASAMATVEKITDALCSVDDSPDLRYAVKIVDKIYNCTKKPPE